MHNSDIKLENSTPNDAGFSLIELLVVLVIIVIMTGTVFYYLNATQELYRPDEQALKISDLLQEARQRSLTQREVMRVEIDLTDNVVRLIDENDSTTVDDDTELRLVPLFSENEVRIDERPRQISVNPPEQFPVPTAQFKQSVYPKSLLHDVATLRFTSLGTVLDQGSNEIGANAVARGNTIHIWSPQKGNINDSNIARSITVIGSTGAIRLWEYDESIKETNKWKDTRRTSIFGAQTGSGNSNTSGNN